MTIWPHDHMASWPHGSHSSCYTSTCYLVSMWPPELYLVGPGCHVTTWAFTGGPALSFNHLSSISESWLQRGRLWGWWNKGMWKKMKTCSVSISSSASPSSHSLSDDVVWSLLCIHVDWLQPPPPHTHTHTHTHTPLDLHTHAQRYIQTRTHSNT